MDGTITKSMKSENSWYGLGGGGVSQKVDEAALGDQGCSRIWGTQECLGRSWRSVLGPTPQRGQGQTRPEIVASWATESVPTLEEDLSFSKFFKVAP